MNFFGILTIIGILLIFYIIRTTKRIIWKIKRLIIVIFSTIISFGNTVGIFKNNIPSQKKEKTIIQKIEKNWKNVIK